MAISLLTPAQSQQQPSFGLFGQSAQPAASSFNVGAAQPVQPPTTGFTFGSAQQAASSAPSFSFGATAPAVWSASAFSISQPAASHSAFSFGAPAATTSAPFQFGTSAPATGGLFGVMPATTSQPLSFSVTQPAAQNQEQPQNPLQDPSIESRIQSIKAAWHPESSSCRFQTFFYNIVDPAQVKAYARPPLAQNDASWFQAVRENPDPGRMVPVIAAGFDDLKKRADAQDRQSALHHAKLSELAGQLQAARTVLQQLSSSRLSRAETMHTALTARITRLVSRLHPLTSMRGTPLRSDEEELHAKVERLSVALTGRGGDQKLAATLNELWVLTARLKAGRNGEESSAEYGVASEEQLNEILGVMAQQQQGLDHLASVVEDELIGIDVVREGFGLPTLSGPIGR